MLKFLGIFLVVLLSQLIHPEISMYLLKNVPNIVDFPPIPNKENNVYSKG